MSELYLYSTWKYTAGFQSILNFQLPRSFCKHSLHKDCTLYDMLLNMCQEARIKWKFQYCLSSFQDPIIGIV
jgi:hypothetical protein